MRKTICRKLEISRRRFMEWFGENTTLKIRKKDGTVATLDFRWPQMITPGFKTSGEHTDPLAMKNWGVSRISALGQVCANCAAETGVQMHHVKHLKTLNVKLNAFDQNMARINRKQVPLCGQCHREVHAGRYQGIALRYFQHIKWWGKGK